MLEGSPSDVNDGLIDNSIADHFSAAYSMLLGVY